MRTHAGQISLPGGRRDPGDASAADTALREAHEEIGLDPDNVEVIGYLADHPTITGYRVTPVVGLVRNPFQPVHHAAEVASVFEVPLELVLDPGNYHRKQLTRNGATVPYFEILHGGYRIWGATAGILRELARHIQSHDRSA
jgi:8-oxo-dGTP pyrophosphatase MutT (NUDIX family)